jgi:hypothetical protein
MVIFHSYVNVYQRVPQRSNGSARLNTEISQVLQDTAPSPAAEQLALWRKELRQTRQFLVPWDEEK